MLALLDPTSEFYLPRRVSASGLNCALLFVGGIPGGVAAQVAADIACLDDEQVTDAELSAYDRLIIYAPQDEATALRDLRQRFPGKRFAGMGSDVLPALAARQTPLTGPEFPDGPVCPPPPCSSLTLVIATPRSGSSHLADTLTEMGQGDCREHFRGDLVTALASGYRFDLTRAVRQFLYIMGQRNQGRVATKLIVGHLLRWLDSRPDPRALREALAGVAVQCIITDRADRVAQAVSGTIAQQSGVWQKRSEPDHKRILDLSEADYDFATLFWRWQSYSRQGHLLDVLSDWFPDRVRLEFDRDLAHTQPQAVARRLSDAFGWAIDPESYIARASHSQPTASPLAPKFAARFQSDLSQLAPHAQSPHALSKTRERLRHIVLSAAPAVPALVLIGFNKCGTSSLSDLFRKCGHPTAHWRTDTGAYLAPMIYSNHHLGRPLLDGLSGYRVISDLFYLDQHVYLEANSLFAEMAVQYPGTRFLLNTRNREAWISSRMGHETPGTGRIIDRACAFFNRPADQVANIWRDQWDSHHNAVRDFFRGYPERLLIYDIDRDHPKRIAGWLGPEWHVDPTRLRHLNRSAPEPPDSQSNA